MVNNNNFVNLKGTFDKIPKLFHILEILHLL